MSKLHHFSFSSRIRLLFYHSVPLKITQNQNACLGLTIILILEGDDRGNDADFGHANDADFVRQAAESCPSGESMPSTYLDPRALCLGLFYEHKLLH